MIVKIEHKLTTVPDAIFYAQVKIGDISLTHTQRENWRGVLAVLEEKL